MPKVNVVCDRCGSEVAGLKLEGGTSGYYDMTATPWVKYAKPGEVAICDSCMARDPDYQRDYSDDGKVKLLRRIDRDFVYHPPTTDEMVDKFVEIRETGRYLASIMISLCPVSRELSLALAKVEEAVMWANAAIARNDGEKRGLDD